MSGDGEKPDLPRRLKNAALPACVYAILLVLAGAYFWYHNESLGAPDTGRAMMKRLSLLGLSIGLAAFLCRMLAGARSARLGLLRPEPGDTGAIAWFGTLVAWGYANPRPVPEDASSIGRAFSWIASGLLDSPLWMVFGVALAATAIVAGIELWLRRALRRRSA